MTDRPPPRERNITPYAPFDSRPKIAAAQPTRAPAEPFEGLPSIPRGPRMPTGFGELPHALGAPHDTDPAELQDAELGDDDKTPSDPESPYEMIIRKLNKVERAVQDSNKGHRRCYQLLLDLNDKLDNEKAERKKLAREVRDLKLANRWVPRLAWLVTTAIAVLALLRTYR